MRYLRKWQLAFVCLLALALLPLMPAQHGTAQAPGYTVTDLGTLGGEASRAYGIDECGRVVGDSQAAAGAAAPFRPFRWSSGAGMIDLGTLGGLSGTAYAINQSDTTAGSATNAGGNLRAFVRPPAGPPQDIGSLGGNTVEAYDINSSGQVVGASEASGGGSLDDRAFVWQSGTMQALTATWGTPVRADGINEAGQVAGTATHNTSGTHAFLWKDTNGNGQSDPGEVKDLGTLGGLISFATKVNDLGEVVGYSYVGSNSSDPSRAYFWKDLNGDGDGVTDTGAADPGEMIDLGTLGGRFSSAYDVNDSGLVVGSAQTSMSSGGMHAFIWSSAGGMQDLNTLVPGTGWTFQEARAINDRGQIVGFGLNPDGKVHAFLLTPSNDPGPPPSCSATPTPTPSPGTLQFSAPTYSAGENGGSVVISVSRDAGSDGTVTVNYATSDGTATEGAAGDYLSSSGTLTFNQGETTKTFSVTINDDATDEPNETVNLTLSSPGGGATLGTRSAAVLTINDDDGQPSLSINDATVTEGDSGTVNATFTVSLLPASGQTVTVNYATADGTAAAGSDYAAVTSTPLTFTPGQTSQTVSVTVNGDTLDEPNETFFVNLSGESNAAVSDAQGQGTITDDDAQPTLQFSDATYSVGEAGVTATITVTRTGGSNGGVTVNYATTAGGTATAGSDYTAISSGTLTFAAGDDSETFTVSINNDTLDESNETVSLALSSPGGGGALGSRSTATLTIDDDDATPTLSVGDATVPEGSDGQTNQVADFAVTLSAPSGQTVTVEFATSNGTALETSDYIAPPVSARTLTFTPGQTSRVISIPVVGDTLDEPDENFGVTLFNPSNATVADGAGVGTITDDDGAPSLSINDVTLAEGNSGTTSFTFTVTKTGSTALDVTVSYATADGTAQDDNPTSEDSDYAPASGTLTLAAGETTKTVTVLVNGDALQEPNETFFVNLSSPSNATVGDSQGVGTIADDDATPSASVNDVAVAEGNSGTTNVTFTVTLSAASGQTVTVNYATSDGTAAAGSDYTSASGTLTFVPGDTSETFTVAAVGDALDEPNETFNVTLSSPTNATVGDGTGVGTINDDDPTPFLSINDVSVNEGNSGDSAATFTVTLSAPSGQTVSVNYASADGTANAGPDYGGTAGTLTFAPGETTKTITVNAFGDTFNEPNETFFVNLSSPSNATVADGQGQGTINNDDAPTFRFSQATYPAGESAHFVTVTVERTGDATSAARVNFATSDGTASERRDYTAVSGRLQFAAGETSKTFDVLLTVDAYAESEETVNLALSSPTGGAALGSQSTATVNIQDTPPPGPNPIDIASDFVRQHYHDFLGREPDAPGLAHWTNQMTNCGNPNLEVCRINVSAAFFQAIEFQQTGYLVYRTYKAAYGDATSPGVPGTVPVIRLQEFLPDTRIIGDGVIVGPPGWEDRLDANKNAYMQEFIERQRFLDAYPLSMTAAEFVDKLNLNAGGVLTQGERNALVSDLSNGAKTRAQVLRNVAENAALQQNEFRRAFVLMQYYGYLRRNPDDAPEKDLNFGGWNFWLGKLNDFNGNFVQAQMVKAFLDSIEYRTRFAP